MKWNNEHIQMLKDGWKAGDRTQDIATAIGVVADCFLTRNAIIGKAYRLKLGPHYRYTGSRKATSVVEPKPKVTSVAEPKPKAAKQYMTATRRQELSLPRSPKPPPPPPIEYEIKRDDKGKETGRVVKSRKLTLFELHSGECRFPTHDGPQPRQYLFCGNQQYQKSSWCEFHHKIVYNNRTTVVDEPEGEKKTSAA